jgi:hypothetical protein
MHATQRFVDSLDRAFGRPAYDSWIEDTTGRAPGSVYDDDGAGRHLVRPSVKRFDEWTFKYVVMEDRYEIKVTLVGGQIMKTDKVTLETTMIPMNEKMHVRLRAGNHRLRRRFSPHEFRKASDFVFDFGSLYFFRFKTRD